MADFTELGSTGLQRSGGFLNEEFLPILKGIRGRRLLREMADNDAVVGALLFSFEQVVKRLEWRVDPCSDPDMSKEQNLTAARYAQFVDECRNDMSESWDSTLANIMTMLVYGWSFHEIVYKQRGGDTDDPTSRSKHTDQRIGWRKWPLRSQETLLRWNFDDDGGVESMIQFDPWGDKKGQQVIPIQKALLFRVNAKKSNPEGRSLLRNAVQSWYYKKRISEIEAVGIERDLAGLPVAYVPQEWLQSSASTDEKAALTAIQEIVTNVKRNEQEGVILPQMIDEAGTVSRVVDLTLLSSGGSRQFDTGAVIARYDQRISMSVLADFLMLGHEGVGSYSLGVSKVDLWTMAVDAIAKSIAQVVNQHAIPRLMRLNGMQTSLAPKLTYGDVSKVSLDDMSNFVQRMIQSGAIMPDEGLDDFLRDLADLPPRANPESL